MINFWWIRYRVLLFIIAFLCVMGTVLENLPRKFSSLGISKVITAFSLKTNMEKILSTRSSPDDLGCLHGIRYLSLAWVVLGHTWAFLPLQFNANGVDMVNVSVKVNSLMLHTAHMTAYFHL